MTKTKHFREQIIEELVLAATTNSSRKDILMVVHDQLPYVKACVESVVANTRDFRLHVWDNGSGPETADYLRSLKGYISDYAYMRVESNEGFIIPNNELVKGGSSPYIILLNSDCEVRPGWDLCMVNYLESHPGVAQVGYSGGRLGADGVGQPQAVYGGEIDYVCGWCFCIPRKVYEQVGLFDQDNLEFAYAEDSDLSLRLRDQGWGIYSLHNDLVVHHGNKTIVEVHHEKGNYLKETFERNHQYIRHRWSRYLIKE